MGASLGSTDQGSDIGDSDLHTRPAPMVQRIIAQDGATFTWQADADWFDQLARPRRVTRSSSLGPTRTEETVYHDDRLKWVMGQVEAVTKVGPGPVKEMARYGFDANASVTSKSSFGPPIETMTYNADGTLASRTDGNGRTTRLLDYFRGIPRAVNYPDGSSESAVVTNIGTVTALTNGALATTRFDYDPMGRIAKVIYPDEDNGPMWNPTVIDFTRVTSQEFDLVAGHWRQNVTTGNARTSTYYDALWRPVYTATSDLGNPGATSRIVKQLYDFGGRTTFASYPQRDYDHIRRGTTTTYDALGRPTLVQAFIEEPDVQASTITTYQSALQKTVTDPRGHSTTTTYQAFDDPARAFVSHIAAPESVLVDIAHDVFGKPTAITRSGLGKSATRSYVYDSRERLCKTIEPETGATVQDYDAANNVLWRASGLALPSSDCGTASVPAASKISFGYDTLNRLTATAYSDGSPSIQRSYAPDGQPGTISSNGALWTNAYYKRGLNKLESLAYGGATYNIGRGYDANGSLSQLSYPDGSAVSYNPNALGEPQQVGGYATSITYHPSGAIAGFKSGNGIVHSLTQHPRGLPWVSADTGVLNDTHEYDANGNVDSIADNLAGISRTMGYDALDRSTSVTAPSLWGTATYSYDSLDNLTASTITGNRTPARSVTFNYPDPATNRLMSASGSAGYNYNYAYDVQGNVIQRDGKQYAFNQGNRMNSAPGVASYAYDGLGHRVSVVGTDAVNRIQIYSQGGQMLQAGPSGGAATRYIYLHNHVIAEVGPAGTQYQHTDAFGSPVARTNAAGGLVSSTKYEPYGKTADGATPTLGFTGHVNDADTGLVYMQQRYYDPVAGRFLSIDPVTTDANTGKSFNRYVYANNNPSKYIDPDGRQAGNMLEPFQGGRYDPGSPKILDPVRCSICLSASDNSSGGESSGPAPEFTNFLQGAWAGGKTVVGNY